MIAVNAAHNAIHPETDLLRRAVKDSRKRLQTLAEQIDAASSRLAELTEGISALTDKLGGLTPPTAETARSTESDGTSLSFWQAMSRATPNGRGCEVPTWLATIMEHSDYPRHLNRWLRHFPRGHLHLVDFASLDADPEGEMNKVLDVLRDAPPSQISPPSVALARVLMVKREQRETMPIHVRQFLSSRYSGWSFEAVASTISAN